MNSCFMVLVRRRGSHQNAQKRMPRNLLMTVSHLSVSHRRNDVASDTHPHPTFTLPPETSSPCMSIGRVYTGKYSQMGHAARSWRTLVFETLPSLFALPTSHMLHVRKHGHGYAGLPSGTRPGPRARQIVCCYLGWRKSRARKPKRE